MIYEIITYHGCIVFCHSGECQNPVKTNIYWMLVFTSMTAGFIKFYLLDCSFHLL